MSLLEWYSSLGGWYVAFLSYYYVIRESDSLREI